MLIETKKLLSESLFRYVKDHPASLWLPCKNKAHKEYFKDITLIEGQYVPVTALRHIKDKYEEQLNADINRKVQIGAYISEDRINTIWRSKVGYKYESTQAGDDTGNTEEKSLEFEICLSAEIVPAFSFEGWPFTANEWINRKREWPSEDVVKKVIDTGCQIIARQPLDNGIDSTSIPEFIERDLEANQKYGNIPDTQTNEIILYERNDQNNADKAEGDSHEEKEQIGAYISEDKINTIGRSKVGYKYESTKTGDDTGNIEEKSLEFERCLPADIVPTVLFEGWPLTANEWINRKRTCPSEDVVKKVIDTGCQIVARQPLDNGIDSTSIPEIIERDLEANKKYGNISDTQTNEIILYERNDQNNADKAEGDSHKENEKDGYFRLSFSRGELVLVKSLSELQVLCWRVLKAYQKAYLETQPQVLTSYHWKTVFFWVVEETKPSFWNEENIMNAVLKMLDRMIVCIEKRFLPLYFVRTQNLITSKNEEAIEKALAKIKFIREKPIERLRQFLNNPPKPDIEKSEKQPAKPQKPMTVLDVLNEKFNDNNADLFSGPEKDVMDLLKETLSLANYRGSLQTDELNESVLICSEETPESQKSSTEQQGQQMEINVRQTFVDVFHQLTGSLYPEDVLNRNQSASGIPESAIPNVESVLKLAGEILKMLSGGESKEDDPDLGRILVKLMNQNQNRNESAPSDTNNAFDFGNLMANMQQLMREEIERQERRNHTQGAEGSSNEK
ncbi:uncharacterized protein LOC127860105 isoform X2 [Dreissena polymorpha]|nr:uncharacterized protein LOC127860105 isoform X2 [Dreissena polymorpha]